MSELEQIHEWSDVCSEFELSYDIAQSYIGVGINSLYHWQVDCLRSSGAITKRRNNVVYCAPTGGGKTLISELVILKTVTNSFKKAIFVLPFVSLVLEKEKYFKKLFLRLNRSKQKSDKLRVKAFYGDVSVLASKQCNLMICTIEKANGLLNSIIMNGQADRLGCIILDEMHVLGEKFNGYLLEMLVSKVLYLERRAEELMLRFRKQKGSNALNRSNQVIPVHIQLVAMSATVSNVDDLAAWLGCCAYISNYRPVELVEHLVVGSECCDVHGNQICTLPINRPNKSMTENEMVVGRLVCDAICHGQQVSIYYLLLPCLSMSIYYHWRLYATMTYCEYIV